MDSTVDSEETLVSGELFDESCGSTVYADDYMPLNDQAVTGDYKVCRDCLLSTRRHSVGRQVHPAHESCLILSMAR